jgi:hypothetical protein
VFFNGLNYLNGFNGWNCLESLPQKAHGQKFLGVFATAPV